MFLVFLFVPSSLSYWGVNREKQGSPWPLVSYNLLTSNQIFGFSNSKFCERPYFADRKSVISWRVPTYVWWTLCHSSWWLSNLRDAGECMKWRTGPLLPQWSHVRIHLAWQYNYCLSDNYCLFNYLSCQSRKVVFEYQCLLPGPSFYISLENNIHTQVWGINQLCLFLKKRDVWKRGVAW